MTEATDDARPKTSKVSPSIRSRRGSSDTTPPPTAVSVYEAIHRRRSAWVYQDRPVPRDVMERVLEAAVWAQNHHLTEPWRFIVVERDSATCRAIAELAAAHAIKASGNPARAALGKKKFSEAPVVVWVYCLRGVNEHDTLENYAAVSAAIQNLALAGVAEGLGLGWDNGGLAHAAGIKEALGAEPGWIQVGALLIGYPLKAATSQRTPASAFTRWAD